MAAPWRKYPRLLLFIAVLALLTGGVCCFSGGKNQLAPALSAADLARLAGEGDPPPAATAPTANDVILRRLQLSVAYLDRTIDTARDCLPFFHHEIGDGAATLAHANWDWCDISSRYALAMLKAGDVLGAVPDRERLVCLQKTILGTLTRDGLAFRRASEFSAVEADVFDQGSVMLYLIEKQRRTGDGEYARLIDRLIASLRRKARPTAHGLRFPYPTMLPNGARGPGADNWDHADPCHHAGRLLYPLALWLRQTPSDKAARRLFDAIAGYVIRDAHVFGADGSFAGHTHARTNTLLGLLIRARDTNDAATEEFVMRSVDWLVRATPRWGWVPEFMPEHGAVKPENTRAETDGLVDLISLLVMLAEKNPAYWDVVDRYVRNGLLSAQFTAAWNGSASPVGAFCGFCRPNAFGSSTMNCCSPAGAGLLADLHRLAVTKAGNEYWVNLLLDRDGPEARIKTDVHGDWFAVTITMKQAGGLVVRLPAFVSGAADVARAPSSVKFEPGLLRFGALSANADVSFSFALPHRTETFSIGGVDYRHAWRGNIVVEVRPAADRFGFFVGEASGVTR